MSQTLEQLEREITQCRKCPRLVAWREEVALTKRRAYQSESYWGKPVPGFGDPNAKVLIVGLAPGAHGSNRTGRMFTGDASGDFLFPALFRTGFANQPTSVSADDGLKLKDLFITAVCRCVPPQNKPTVTEIKNCLPYLAAEIEHFPQLEGFVALGRIGFEGIGRMYQMQGVSLPKLAFGHNVLHQLGEGLPWLLTSYHPSRQNTQTGRLTQEDFDAIWTRARKLIG